MKQEIKIIDIAMFAFAIVLSIINIALVTNELKEYKNISNTNIVYTSDNNVQTNELNKLQDMEERDRMEYYFAKFIDNIEEGDYQKSYDLLYKDFKDEFFPTLDKFVKYVNKTYGESPTFLYKDIERQGNIYVLMIDIVNVKDKTKNKSQRIVIKENGFDDFVISFQVI